MLWLVLYKAYKAVLKHLQHILKDVHEKLLNSQSQAIVHTSCHKHCKVLQVSITISIFVDNYNQST